MKYGSDHRTIKDYQDILDLPYEKEKIAPKHPPMSDYARAAQFSPFAALTGYEEVIKESGRLTEGLRILDEQEKQQLNEQFLWLQGHIEEAPFVEITYFLPDLRKQGGSYERAAGNLKKIDSWKKELTLADGSVINAENIVKIDY